MGIKLIEKIHEQVYFERADTQHHMLLSLSSVAAVIPSRLLPLHPQVDQLLKLMHSTLSDNTTQTNQNTGKKSSYFSLFLPAEAAPPEPHKSWWLPAAARAICGESHLQSPLWRRWRCRSRRSWRATDSCLLAPGAGFHMCCAEQINKHSISIYGYHALWSRQHKTLILFN